MSMKPEAKCTCKGAGEEPIVELLATEHIGPGQNGEQLVAKQWVCHKCHATWSEVVDARPGRP